MRLVQGRYSEHARVPARPQLDWCGYIRKMYEIFCSKFWWGRGALHCGVLCVSCSDGVDCRTVPLNLWCRFQVIPQKSKAGIALCLSLYTVCAVSCESLSCLASGSPSFHLAETDQTDCGAVAQDTWTTKNLPANFGVWRDLFPGSRKKTFPEKIWLENTWHTFQFCPTVE